jgi:hypothetical protein
LTRSAQLAALPEKKLASEQAFLRKLSKESPEQQLALWTKNIDALKEIQNALDTKATPEELAAMFGEQAAAEPSEAEATQRKVEAKKEVKNKLDAIIELLNKQKSVIASEVKRTCCRS